MDNVELVRRFLRAQNLEQLGRPEEAVRLYEEAVAAGFDSSGPYDRLIALYGDRALHAEVIRIADSALANVQTHEEKRGWYVQVRAEAERARQRVPRAAPKQERD
jgi:hypothetical protein